MFRYVCTEYKNLIRSEFTKIVKEVEVRGHILDEMISNNVISFEHRNEIDLVPTKGDRARKLIERILTSSNLQAHYCFLEALKHDYKVLADKLSAKLLRECSSEGEGDIISSSFLASNYQHLAFELVRVSFISSNVFNIFKVSNSQFFLHFSMERQLAIYTK